MEHIINQTKYSQLTVTMPEWKSEIKLEQVSILGDGAKFNTGRMSLSKVELIELRDYLNSIDLEDN